MYLEMKKMEVYITAGIIALSIIICIIWCALEPVIKRKIRKRKQKKYGKMKH
jgi:hypothetical protein